MKIKAKNLLTTHRFDLIIKYLYVKSYYNKYETYYFLEMYKHHLKIWNNFIEYDNPDKNTFESFKSIFEKLIDDITTNGFDENKSKVPTVGNSILNGSHRVASSLINNNEVSCVGGIDRVDGQLECGWEMFKKLGLKREYADISTLEYAKLKTNTHVVTIFPSVMDNMDKVNDILNKYSKVFYTKEIKLNETGMFNLMREFYYGETWAGTHPDYNGFRSKAKLCYGEGNTIIYLCEFDNIEDTILVKKLIRDIYNIGNHSIHINDSHDETIRLSKLLFNDNSIHFLNNNKSISISSDFTINDQIKFNRFENSIEYYRNYFKQNNIDSDNYCISASSVLSIYGLREGDDIDYIHNGEEKIKGNPLINSHNLYGYESKIYPYTYDDIIFNPNLHFYSMGIKFVSLDVVRRIKEIRGEDKDKLDIKLIDSIK